MQLLKIFREKIASMDTSRFEKSESRAAELRKQGNDLFVQDHFNQAIDLYTEVNKCICEVPSVKVSNNKRLELAFEISGDTLCAPRHKRRFERRIGNLCCKSICGPVSRRSTSRVSPGHRVCPHPGLPRETEGETDEKKTSLSGGTGETG